MPDVARLTRFRDHRRNFFERKKNMKNEKKKKLIAACILLALFALWTVAVCRVDVQPIGAEGTNVGFARLYAAFSE